MIPMPIGEFMVGAKTPVNLYIRLGDHKFVLILKGGSAYNRERLESYNNKEVHYLWIERKDFQKLAQQSIAIAGVIVSKNNLGLTQKTNILSHAARTVFTQLEHMGISLEMYMNAKLITEVMVSLCESHTELSDLFLGLKNCSADHLISHSMAVSVVSVLIGTAMGWEQRVTLEKLSLGGLLHEIGQRTLPADLIKKPLVQMSPEEMAHWETHCFRGMELVVSLGIVPDDIVSIIYEHHENSIGQGYPRRIRDMKIHPLARVVALADQFIDLITVNPNCPVPKNPREALMYIEHTMGQPFNRECFKALRKIVEQVDLTLKVS